MRGEASHEIWMVVLVKVLEGIVTVSRERERERERER